jgi:hypothetical protein
MTHDQAYVLVGVILGLVLVLGNLYRKHRWPPAPPRPVETPRQVRRPRPTPPAASAPYPYIRGTALYWRSRESLNIAPFARQAQGLPPYHVESQWRDPPG